MQIEEYVHPDSVYRKFKHA
jgi:serine/threonine protein kinase